MAGDKLERLDRSGVGDTAGSWSGRVLEAEKHPDADRLSVCVVDDGSGEPRTIVRRSRTWPPGQTVAVALPGAVMPDGTERRGQAARGQVERDDPRRGRARHRHRSRRDHCAGRRRRPGEPLAVHLPIADEVLEIEVTPNRPDVMSVYGVARDLHAVTGAELAPDPTAEDAEASGDDQASDHASIEIDPDICLRFTARVFEDVRIAPSPPWLKQRLLAARRARSRTSWTSRTT